MKHKKTTIAIILIAVLIIAYLIQNYNYLNNYREKVNNDYSDLSIVIDKKLDISKNIYKDLSNNNYKSSYLDKLKTANKNLEDAYNISDKNKYNDQISEYIEKIEKKINDTDYHTTENYNNLIKQYNSQNEKISKSIEKYNKSVNNYNNKLSTIPNNITSKLFGMKLETNYK